MKEWNKPDVEEIDIEKTESGTSSEAFETFQYFATSDGQTSNPS